GLHAQCTLREDGRDLRWRGVLRDAPRRIAPSVGSGNCVGQARDREHHDQREKRPQAAGVCLAHALSSLTIAPASRGGYIRREFEPDPRDPVVVSYSQSPIVPVYSHRPKRLPRTNVFELQAGMERIVAEALEGLPRLRPNIRRQVFEKLPKPLTGPRVHISSGSSARVRPAPMSATP